MLRWTAVLCLSAAFACGGKQAAPPSAKPAAAQDPVAAGSDTAGAAGSDAGGETLSSDTGEGRLAAGTVSAYLHAVAVKDWAGACATRTRSDRAQLVKLAGSCERGLQQRLAKQSIEGYATATPGAIRQRADTVAVDIVQPGPSTPAETLYLKREDGLWLLVELPAADAF